MGNRDARFVVGIDLGTTNCALAYVDLRSDADLAAAITVLPVPQLIAPGETAARRILPSSVYLPSEHELPAGATRLPWGDGPMVVGELAKLQGARVPGRMVSSAKSWLCHEGVDRLAPILPWGAPEGVPRISPVTASAHYLSHMKEAFHHRFPDAPLDEQDVVLTVPASFDEVARELTVRAARDAGLDRLTLVEEPQAAFYDFTAKHRGRLAEALGPHRLILVCDVGGGTTDLTLIQASAGEKGPVLTRIAVGDHLMLGGDNMDVALARKVEAKLAARVDAAQWTMLVQACRLAKESLLAPGGPASTRVSIVGRGSRLVGSALSAELSRDEVLSIVVDGFLPRVRSDEEPARSRAGLHELGLPYAAEPAITRHVAAFLRRHARETGEGAGLPRPDAILLNGGVFKPREVGERLVEVLSGFWPDRPPIVLLEAEALDVAVARGAAYYGLVRRGLGLRIGGGSARAYFVGLSDNDRERKALCILPREMEERTEVEVQRDFALVLDRPVKFSLFASSLSHGAKVGDVQAVDEETFTRLPPIQTVLRSGAAGAATATAPVEVPVHLRAALTELGTLELWCVAKDRDARWKLEFQLRGSQDDAGAVSAVAPMPARFAEARDLVDVVYGKKPVPVDKKDVKNLVRSLEKVLGPREGWTTPVIRELWGALHAGMAKRRRSVDHERLWCNLTGFCLRPGFGAPLDGWRAAETFKIFEQGLQFQAEAHNWEAFWVLWRRIAAGLDAPAQKRLFDTVAPFLRPVPQGKTAPRPRGVKPEGLDEMIRLVSSLERIDAELKVEAGGWMLEKVRLLGPLPHLLWAVGRLGARVPFYGSGHACVPPATAERWAEALSPLDPSRPDGLGFALAQLARLSGDRARDLSDSTREAVARRLERLDAPTDRVRMVREVVVLSGGDEQRVFGESLPAGLRLVSAP